jgi:hypothetical protein
VLDEVGEEQSEPSVRARLDQPAVAQRGLGFRPGVLGVPDGGGGERDERPRLRGGLAVVRGRLAQHVGGGAAREEELRAEVVALADEDVRVLDRERRQRVERRVDARGPAQPDVGGGDGQDAERAPRQPELELVTDVERARRELRTALVVGAGDREIRRSAEEAHASCGARRLVDAVEQRLGLLPERRQGRAARHDEQARRDQLQLCVEVVVRGGRELRDELFEPLVARLRGD